MDELQYYRELSKCVRCGACKALCPTYLSALNETMGARGRIAMLGELRKKRFLPTKRLSERIFSCILCEACRELCPTGINIPEIIYHGRTELRGSYIWGRLLGMVLKFSLSRMDTVFFILRGLQKLFYQPLYRKGRLRYFPMIVSKPFKNNFQVYKSIKKINRIALFVGCNINYLYPHLGKALLDILLAKGYEVVVVKGEVCCGAPMRSLGLEQEASLLAKKNVELFKKMRVEAILSMCPTCTMVIKHHYPLLIGEGITNIMDVNEFFIKYNIAKGLKIVPKVVTYHDPCRLRYGLGIKVEPRRILKDIQGIKLVEMQNADECCGFGGFFSLCFKDLSKTIGRKKIDNIYNTWADIVVTSCPGCMMQLEDLKKETDIKISIMHVVEVVNEAMHG
jgi:glycolate oxidase iron-sulfur subunit